MVGRHLATCSKQGPAPRIVVSRFNRSSLPVVGVRSTFKLVAGYFYYSFYMVYMQICIICQADDSHMPVHWKLQ